LGFDETIDNGKKGYGYYLNLYARSGYEIDENVKLYINSEEANGSVLSHGSGNIELRYEFPEYVKA